MAITYVNASTSTAPQGTGGNVGLAMPASVADGDLLLCWTTSRDNQAHSLPAGWVQKVQSSNGASTQVSLFYARYKASSPNSANNEVNAATVTHSGTGAIIARITAWRGVISWARQADPVDVLSASLSATGTSLNTPAITTLTPNTEIIWFSGAGTGDVTQSMSAITGPCSTASPGSGGTATNVGGRASQSIYRSASPQAAAGSTGAATGTAAAAPTTATGWAAYLVAIISDGEARRSTTVSPHENLPDIFGSAQRSTTATPRQPRQIYPTAPGGREWALPADATVTDGEWEPNVTGNSTVTQVSSGIFQVVDSNGEVRMDVGSPSGKAWWRNVEMTGYFRAVNYSSLTPPNPPHWELLARSERHGANTETPRKNEVNGGVAPPVGTVTWPWWDSLLDTDYVNVHALGSSYHGNVYVKNNPGVQTSDYTHLEKEFTHSLGYADTTKHLLSPADWPIEVVGALDSSHPTIWFGLKFIVVNTSPTTVRTELWIDKLCDDNWEQISAFDDVQGAWPIASLGSDGASYVFNSTTVPGCSEAPYNLDLAAPLTWAGPGVMFRADETTTQFRSLSVREIEVPSTTVPAGYFDPEVIQSGWFDAEKVNAAARFDRQLAAAAASTGTTSTDRRSTTAQTQATGTQRRSTKAAAQATATQQRSATAQPQVVATSRRAETAQGQATATARRSETAQGQATATARRSEKTQAQATATARRSTATTAQAASTQRRAETTQAQATATARRSETTQPQATATARRSETAQPNIVSTSRRSTAVATQATATSRRSEKAQGQAQATARRSETTQPQGTGTSRRAETAQAQATATSRRSETAQANVVSSARRASATLPQATAQQRRSATVTPNSSDGVGTGLRSTTAQGQATSKAQRSTGTTAQAAGTTRRSETAQANVVATTRRATQATAQGQGTPRRSTKAQAQAAATGQRAETVQPQATTSARRSTTSQTQAVASTRRSSTTRGQAAGAERRAATTTAQGTGTSRRAETTQAQAVGSTKRAATVSAQYAGTSRRSTVVVTQAVRAGRRSTTVQPAGRAIGFDIDLLVAFPEKDLTVEPRVDLLTATEGIDLVVEALAEDLIRPPN